MPLAKQYSSVPTNKVFAGAPTAALVSAAWSEIAVGFGIEALAGPGVAALVGFVAALLVAWYVPDSANVPVDQTGNPVNVVVDPVAPTVVVQATPKPVNEGV